jgi:hypothetical protein
MQSGVRISTFSFQSRFRMKIPSFVPRLAGFMLGARPQASIANAGNGGYCSGWQPIPVAKRASSRRTPRSPPFLERTDAQLGSSLLSVGDSPAKPLTRPRLRGSPLPPASPSYRVAGCQKGTPSAAPPFSAIPEKARRPRIEPPLSTVALRRPPNRCRRNGKRRSSCAHGTE